MGACLLQSRVILCNLLQRKQKLFPRAFCKGTPLCETSAPGGPAGPADRSLAIDATTGAPALETHAERSDLEFPFAVFRSFPEAETCSRGTAGLLGDLPEPPGLRLEFGLSHLSHPCPGAPPREDELQV